MLYYLLSPAMRAASSEELYGHSEFSTLAMNECSYWQHLQCIAGTVFLLHVTCKDANT